MPFKDPEKAKAYHKKYIEQWNLDNPDYYQQHYEKNKEYILNRNRQYYKDNRQDIIKQKSEYEKNRCNTDMVER